MNASNGEGKVFSFTFEHKKLGNRPIFLFFLQIRAVPPCLRRPVEELSCVKNDLRFNETFH